MPQASSILTAFTLAKVLSQERKQERLVSAVALAPWAAKILLLGMMTKDSRQVQWLDWLLAGSMMLNLKFVWAEFFKSE